MAFPASVQTQANALEAARNTAVNTKRMAIGIRDFLAANTVSANRILQIMTEIKSTIETWDAAAAVPGIGAYAKKQYNNTNLDLATEFTSMTDAAKAVRDRIIADFPSYQGYILKDQLTADGSISVRQFTPVQTEGLRIALDALVATIG